MFRTSIALLLLVTACADEPPPDDGTDQPIVVGPDADKAECEQECSTDHDTCLDYCERKPESEQLHCVSSICLDALDECRDDCG